MTDNRGATPTPDSSGFYSFGAVQSVPMQGPEDMPEPALSEMFNAGLVSQEARNTDAEQNRVKAAYEPIIEALNASYDPQYSGLPSRGLLAIPRSAFENPGFVGQRHRDTDSDERYIWDYISARRRLDPKFLPNAPKSREEFYAQVTQAEQRRRAAAAGVSARNSSTSGSVAEFLGGTVMGFDDPAVGMTLPIGGFGRTLATRVITEGIAQMGVQALIEPQTVKNLHDLGEEMTPGQIALDIGAAGVGGAAFQGIIAEPVGALLKRFLGTVPVESMTDAERGAVDFLQRDAAITETSPFMPGHGTETHFERLDQSITAITANLPGASPSVRSQLGSGTALGSGTLPRAAADVAAPVATEARAVVKARIARAENATGDPNARNPHSTATGKYQFTEGTWRHYYIQRFGRGGLTDAQIAAKRSDSTLQDTLVDDLLADNARTLRRIGQRETAGNLYLLHFAGEKGGADILRAAPDTPIERILSEDAITANPFLRGKTAGEVVEWAHARMGERVDAAAAVRRDQFAEGEAGDAEWSAAQRASDLAALESERANSDFETGYLASPGERRLARSEMAAAEIVPVEETPHPFSGQPDYQAGYLADAGERQAARADYGPIDPANEVVHGDWGSAPEPREAAPERQTYAIEVAPASEAQAATRTIYVSGRGEERINAASAREGGATVELDEGNGAALIQSSQGVESVPFSSKQGNGMRPVRLAASPATGGQAQAGKGWSAVLKEGANATATRTVPVAKDVATASAENGIASTVASAFNDPGGVAARVLAEGISHDLNQALETGELGNIHFAADGIEISGGDHAPLYRDARSVLAELDAEDAAIAALEACL